MLPINKPTGVLFFLSVLYRSDLFQEQELKQQIHERLDFKVCAEFEPQLTSMKDYYKHEMGTPLRRLIFIDQKVRERDQLVALKKRCLEVEYEKGDGRLLNLDPGYLALDQVVLSSAKPYAHRIFARDNLYLELCLFFKQSEFLPLYWTYPDYSSADVIDFFKFFRHFLSLRLPKSSTS